MRDCLETRRRRAAEGFSRSRQESLRGDIGDIGPEDRRAGARKDPPDRPVRVSGQALSVLRGLLTALALAAGGPAAAQATDCGQAATQIEANACAGKAAQAADAQLNAVWGRAFGAVKGGSAAEPLRAAQRAWIGYRDLACQAEAAVYAGGSIAPLVYSQCLERLTRARIADLKLFLEN